MDIDHPENIRAQVSSVLAFHNGGRWSAFRCFVSISGFLTAGSIALLHAGAASWLVLPEEVLLIARRQLK